MNNIKTSALVLFNLALLWKIKFWLYVTGSVPLWDFDIYHRTVRDVLAGANLFELPYMQLSGPPLMLVPFLPLAFVPIELGRAILNVANLLAGGGSCWLLVRYLWPKIGTDQKINLALFLNAMLLLTFPARFNFITGQPNLILMWLITLVLVGRTSWIQGMATGVMAVIKTNYFVLFLSLFTHSRSTFLWASNVIAICFIVSLGLLSNQGLAEFFSQRGPSLFLTSAPTTDVDYYNQSLRATMGRLQLGEWYPITFFVLAFLGLGYLLKSGSLKVGILLSLLLSPIIWQHYMVVVYPLLLVSGVAVWKTKKFNLWYLLSAGLVLLHFPNLHGNPATWPFNVLASHFFFGLVAFLVYCIYQEITDSGVARTQWFTASKVINDISK